MSIEEIRQASHKTRKRSLTLRTLVTATVLLRLVTCFPALAAESARDAAVRIAAAGWDVPMAELEVTGEVEVDGVIRFKVFHPETRRFRSVDLDADHRELPAPVIRQKLAARRGRDFEGKKEKELAEKIASDAAAGTTSVIVWARTFGPPPFLASDGGRPSVVALEAFKAHHRNSTRSIWELAERKGWTVEYQAENAPLIVLSVPNGELDTLEKRNDVDALYMERVYENELDTSAAAIDAPVVWSRGITGTGVTTAVVEGGAIYYGHVNLADGQYCNPDLASTSLSSHASGVAGIIASTHATNRGVAYGAPAVLSGNTRGGTDSDIITCTEWAINRGAKVINYSIGVDSSNSLTGLDRYVDYVVRYRRVTMVKAAGNIGKTCLPPESYVTSPGKGWNIITVGNYNNRETPGNSDDIMHSESCFGDPDSPHGDREKPEVSAPGSGIRTTYCISPSTCLSTGPSGTSFASPHVVGCAALMMQRNSVLQSWPESIRAVLMATAVVNLEGETRLSKIDGAGGIECDSADDVLRGASGGEQHGSFSLADFSKTFTFNATAGQTVRVAIAWDSDTNSISGTTPPTTDDLKADLDLWVLTSSGSSVAISASWDNAYEIVEFTAPATGTYIAEVPAYRFDGTSEFLGFAWWAGVREDN